jgi:hypothetical protein
MNLVMTTALVASALLAQANRQPPPARLPRLCAIPLLNALPAPAHYHITIVPPPGRTIGRMAEVRVPAPPCESLPPRR